jgi:hypothetical protein
MKNPALEGETSGALEARPSELKTVYLFFSDCCLGFDLVHVEENLKRLIQHIACDTLDRYESARFLANLRY